VPPLALPVQVIPAEERVQEKEAVGQPWMTVWVSDVGLLQQVVRLPLLSMTMG
jgi:hypothetical protein